MKQFLKSTFWDYAFPALVIAWIIIALAAPAPAQEHHHPPEDEAIHEKFYNKWMMPNNRKISCCHKMDCYPTEAKKQGENWLAKRREDGKWLRVPNDKVENEIDNPDGRNHLCAPTPDKGETVYCFQPGAGY